MTRRRKKPGGRPPYSEKKLESIGAKIVGFVATGSINETLDSNYDAYSLSYLRDKFRHHPQTIIKAIEPYLWRPIGTVGIGTITTSNGLKVVRFPLVTATTALSESNSAEELSKIRAKLIVLISWVDNIIKMLEHGKDTKRAMEELQALKRVLSLMVHYE